MPKMHAPRVFDIQRGWGTRFRAYAKTSANQKMRRDRLRMIIDVHRSCTTGKTLNQHLLTWRFFNLLTSRSYDGEEPMKCLKLMLINFAQEFICRTRKCRLTTRPPGTGSPPPWKLALRSSLPVPRRPPPARLPPRPRTRQ